MCRYTQLTYQKELNILIYDGQDALRNFSKEVNLESCIVRDEDGIMGIGDVIVLGPYKISRNSIKLMVEKNIIIIDLKWHLYDDKLKESNNFKLV